VPRAAGEPARCRPEIDTKHGFRGVMQTFNNTRPVVAAMGIGVVRAELENARELLKAHGYRAEDDCKRVEHSSVERRSVAGTNWLRHAVVRSSAAMRASARSSANSSRPRWGALPFVELTASARGRLEWRATVWRSTAGPRRRRGVLHPFKTAFHRIVAMTALNARYKLADGEARHP